jgi:hypothetical protein
LVLDVGTLEKDMKKAMMNLKYQLHEGDGTFYGENDNEVTLELCFSRIVYDYFPPVILLNALN